MADDLERRLKEWGSWAAEMGPIPDLRRASPRRRLAPLLAAAAVVAVAAGSVLLAGGSGPSPATPPATTPAVAFEVVPWAHLRYPGLPPVAAPSIDPTVPACRSGQLVATAGEGGAGGGNLFVPLRLVLRPGAPRCLLDSQPSQLSGTAASGARRAIKLDANPAHDEPTLVPVVLDGDAVGETDLRYYTRCDGGATQHENGTLHDIDISWDTVTVPVTGWDLPLGCFRPDGTMISSRAGGVPPQKPPVPNPTLGLQASLQLPTHVRAGTTLRYTITLTNGSPSHIALYPCPPFVQTLTGVAKEAGLLNCPAAHPVPAGGSEVFAMELAVPATAPGGIYVLGWHAADALNALGQVEVGGAP